MPHQPACAHDGLSSKKADGGRSFLLFMNSAEITPFRNSQTTAKEPKGNMQRACMNDATKDADRREGPKKKGGNIVNYTNMSTDVRRNVMMDTNKLHRDNYIA